MYIIRLYDITYMILHLCYDISYDMIYHSTLLRKPADRLGKVVLANEVSIRGSGG